MYCSLPGQIELRAREFRNRGLLSVNSILVLKILEN